MTSVTWQEKLDATNGFKPVEFSNVGGVYYEDYNLYDGYWRYTWTNFTMDDHPETVEVYKMEVIEDDG